MFSSKSFIVSSLTFRSFFFFKVFVYLWLCLILVFVRGLSLVVASGGHSSSRCVGLSLSRPLLLQSTGSRHTRSVIVAHGPSCSAAHGIFPDQGSNLCPLHWQADSQPLRHQGSPLHFIDMFYLKNQWSLTFRSLILFEFIFVCGVREFSNFILLHGCPVFPAPLIEETVFSPLYILVSFVIDLLTISAWVNLWAFYPVPLICISVFVLVPYCLDYCSFVV